MGDVGSVPLGFAAGGLLIALALAGHPVPALILPLYYLADATWTLLRRLLRRRKIWQAHKEHFYQRAVQRGASHASVARAVALCNLSLIGCATVAVRLSPWIGLSAAVLTVALLLLWMRGGIGSKAGARGN
jgi:UDP-N-acetylmuramyl pentapeptide phosphotransferase/UDP-N-acetylglucosamine-1-phosphate transferase